MSYHVLIVDDDPAICKLLSKVMISNEMDPLVVNSGAAALDLIARQSSTLDMILMDITLGDMEGFDVIQTIRRNGVTTPVIIISGRNEDYDFMYGLSLGADDYVRKPFGAAELRAKVAAHLRRERRPRSHALSFGEVRIDLGARDLAVGGEAVPLTPTEYAICEYLARHPGQVMSRAQIREAVLGWESDADDAAISMQVSRARRKLSEAGADPIATVWGMGYKWQL